VNKTLNAFAGFNCLNGLTSANKRQRDAKEASRYLVGKTRARFDETLVLLTFFFYNIWFWHGSGFV